MIQNAFEEGKIEEQKHFSSDSDLLNLENEEEDDFKSNIIVLDRSEDCTVIVCSTLTEEFEELMKTFDFSSSVEEIQNDSSDSQ